jgi:phosphopantothenoylcysteine synthetase/decarboxylase
MAELKCIYLVVSGASAARSIPDLIRALGVLNLPIYTFLTEGARSLISPYNLADQQGHRLVDSYFDPILIDGRAPGLTLVVPATFNTLNKISQGIADTLPHSLVAEAIGAGWPVIVVPAMNPPLAKHPQVAQSLKTLQRWGIIVLEPHLHGDTLMMVSIETILGRARAVIERPHTERPVDE